MQLDVISSLISGAMVGRLLHRSSPYQMTDVDSSLDLFIATGRAGRRNALANIRDTEVCNTSTAGLPFQLEKLQCSDDNESNKPDSACSSTPSTSDKNSEKSEKQNEKKS